MYLILCGVTRRKYWYPIEDEFDEEYTPEDLIRRILGHTFMVRAYDDKAHADSGVNPFYINIRNIERIYIHE